MAIAINVTVTQEGLNCYTEDCCKTVGRELTITPEYTLGDVSCPTSTLDYLITDYSGNVVHTDSFSITNASPEAGSLLATTFTPTSVGDYTLRVTLTDCAESLVLEETIKVCNYVVVSSNTNAHSYKVCNGHLTDSIKVSITDLNGAAVNSYTDITIAAGSNSDFTFSTDGIYIFVAKTTADVIISRFIIIDVYDVTNCVGIKIQNILCSDCGCNKCKDHCKGRWEINRILPTFLTLMALVNREKKLNSIYTSLDSAKITELTTMDALLTKLSTFCESCGTLDLDNNSIVDNYDDQDCGCS
ncbi:MAG TPA: hypothetical protein VIK84_00165 [Haloplasmataceae bacterium]